MDLPTINRRPVVMRTWYATLPVRSVEQTADYFVNVLGFYCPGYGYRGGRKVDCMVERDQAVVCLQELRSGQSPRTVRGICVASDHDVHEPLVDGVVLVADAVAYHGEVATRGATIVQPLTGGEEPSFVVEEPNGYWLRFWQG